MDELLEAAVLLVAGDLISDTFKQWQNRPKDKQATERLQTSMNRALSIISQKLRGKMMSTASGIRIIMPTTFDVENGQAEAELKSIDDKLLGHIVLKLGGKAPTVRWWKKAESYERQELSPLLNLLKESIQAMHIAMKKNLSETPVQIPSIKQPSKLEQMVSWLQSLSVENKEEIEVGIETLELELARGHLVTLPAGWDYFRKHSGLSGELFSKMAQLAQRLGLRPTDLRSAIDTMLLSHVKRKQPRFGSAAGIKISDDFDAPLEEFDPYDEIQAACRESHENIGEDGCLSCGLNSK